MKQGHFFCVFIVIVFSCWLSLYVVQKQYDAVINEKHRLEHILLMAAEDAGNKYRVALREDMEKKKQIVEDAFTDAFHVFMGQFDMPAGEEFWRLYMPMLILVEEDGALFYHLQNDSTGELRHIWTEKLDFIFPDDCDEPKKKALIADVLERQASEIITNHNIVASQYGIRYIFSLPNFFQDVSRMTEFPMLFVVFQGWPLNSFHTAFYNTCVDAGIFLRPRNGVKSEYPKILD